MTEWRLFAKDTVPFCTTAEFYQDRQRAFHLEQDGHRERLLLAADMVKEAVTTLGVHSVSDLGAGDGGLLSLIHGFPGVYSWGYDLSPEAVKGAAQRGMHVRLVDVVRESERVLLGDLSVVTELLEHLIDPIGLLHRIVECSRALV